LEKVVEYSVKQDTDNIPEQAMAIAELGDWYLLFDRRQSAKNAYQLALNTLKSVEPTPTEVLLFDQPTMIEFTTLHNIAKDGGDHPQLEVAMTISAAGKISDIEVLSSEPILSQQQLKNFKRNLRNIRFRPKLADGIPVTSAHRAGFPVSLLER
jgi:hypothetical protein